MSHLQPILLTSKLMSLADYITSEVDPWKRKRFGDEIPLVRVLDSLSTDEPLVYVQEPTVGVRWTVRIGGTKLNIQIHSLVALAM